MCITGVQMENLELHWSLQGRNKVWRIRCQHQDRENFRYLTMYHICSLSLRNISKAIKGCKLNYVAGPRSLPLTFAPALL